MCLEENRLNGERRGLAEFDLPTVEELSFGGWSELIVEDELYWEGWVSSVAEELKVRNEGDEKERVLRSRMLAEEARRESGVGCRSAGEAR